MGELFWKKERVTYCKDRKKWRGFLTRTKEDGKRESISKTLKATNKTAAKEELSAWHIEIEKALQEDRDKVAAEAATNLQVPNYVKRLIDTKEATKAIEASTAVGYRASLTHIEAAFKGVALEDVETRAVEEWLIGMNAAGLSSSTVGKAFRLLKMALGCAVGDGKIQRNPCNPVKPPKRVNKNPGINSLDQVTVLGFLDTLAAMPLSRLSVAAFIAIHTGMRRGEICGLQWRDIDEDAGRIWVRRVEAIGKGVYEKAPKNDQQRDVVLTSTLLDTLRRWKDQQRNTFREQGSTLDGYSYVIGDALGCYDPNRLSKDWSSLAKTLGMRGSEGRYLHFHDLRHTFGTVAVATGIDIKTVSSNLGHSNAAMTLNIYATADPNAKRLAASQMEQSLKRSA